MTRRGIEGRRAATLLQDANPVNADDLRREFSAEDIEAARGAAVARSPRDSSDGSVAGNAGRRSHRRLGLAIAAVALAGIGALALLPSGSTGPVPPSDGLVAVAAVAESRPAVTPGPGEFAYQRSRWWELVLSERVDERVRTGTTEVWLSAEGHGTVAPHPEREAPCRSPEDSLRRSLGLYCAGSAFAVPAPPPLTAPGQSPPLGRIGGRVDDLPTEADALEKALLANVRRAPASSRFFADHVDPDVELFTLMGDVLANPLATPELRGAVFQLLAQDGAVELEEGVTDPEGRSGSAATITARFHLPGVYKAGRGDFPGGTAHARYEIIFDPETSELLAERVVLLDVDAPGLDALGLVEIDRPTAIEHKVYLESALVDSAEEVYERRPTLVRPEGSPRSEFARKCPEAHDRFEEAGWETSWPVGPESPCPGLAEVEALIEFCPPARGGADTPCRVTSIGSDEEGDGPERVGQSLAKYGIHPEECPDAVAAFEAAGAPPVDAFMGDCPTAAETERFLSGR